MGKLIKNPKLKRNKVDVPRKSQDTSFKLKKHKKSYVLKLSKAAGVNSPRIRKKTKSEKKKIKSDKLKLKFDKTIAAFKEDKARKSREARPVIGDLKPLLDSLPSIDELLSIRDSSNKTGIAAIDRRIPKPPRNKKERINKKTESMLDRFDSVQKIWRDPEFQKSPRKLIQEQIQQRRRLTELK